MRFNNIVRRLRERIELDLPVVLINANRINEIHEMRKDYKKLRYLLEVVPDQNNNNSKNDKEIHKMIAELEDIPDLLGSIHDSDTMIAYLKRVRHPNEVTHILHEEISERNKKYENLSNFANEAYQILDTIFLTGSRSCPRIRKYQLNLMNRCIQID